MVESRYYFLAQRSSRH